MTFPISGFHLQALKTHIDTVHSMIKQEHSSATPSPPLSAFYRQSFQPIGTSLPSPPASSSALDSSLCNEPTSLATNGRSSSSNSNSSSSSSSSSSCSRSTSAGGGLSAATAAAIADEGGRSISPTYSNSSSIGGGSNCGVGGGHGGSSSNGGEPYACLQCSASFPNRDLLEKHELMHVPNALVVSCSLLTLTRLPYLEYLFYTQRLGLFIFVG